MAKGVSLSLLIIALGMAWLLNTLQFIRGVDWIWTLLLGILGVITLAWWKINKLSFVMGTFLVVASVFSILRQTGKISIDIEVPLLVILFGLLFLIAQLPAIPWPRKLVEMREEARKEAEKIS
jgi:hypothetical protein